MANMYDCSDGSRVSQATIDRRYAEARKKKYAGTFARLLCESCGEPGNDNDHTVAQARCKVIHKTELIWNPENFPWSCRKCHREWENFKSGNWTKHGNVEQRLRFLKTHDPEGFIIRIELTTHSLEQHDTTARSTTESLQRSEEA